MPMKATRTQTGLNLQDLEVQNIIFFSIGIQVLISKHLEKT